jgi:AI-2 transport protein TqsA
LVLFVAVVCVLLYVLSIQLVSFSQDVPALQSRFMHLSNDAHQWVTERFKINNRQQTDYLNSSILSVIETAGKSVSSVLFTLSGLFFFVVFVLIFTFFILFHRRLLLRFTVQLFSVNNRPKVTEVIMETKMMINSYVVGLMIEMLIMSVANSAFLLLIGVKYAILLGVLAAVLNIIPYIGIYSAIGIIMLVTLANSSLALSLEAGVGMIVLHFIDANIMLPRIIGSRVKMNPFITIIAVIVGEFLWGIPGMFLFIPIIGIIKLICERVEGLEAWAILIGVDEDNPKRVKKISLSNPE